MATNGQMAQMAQMVQLEQACYLQFIIFFRKLDRVTPFSISYVSLFETHLRLEIEGSQSKIENLYVSKGTCICFLWAEVKLSLLVPSHGSHN